MGSDPGDLQEVRKEALHNGGGLNNDPIKFRPCSNRGTQHPGSPEEAGKEDFLEEVTFELSCVMTVHFPRRWRHIWFKAVCGNGQLSNNLSCLLLHP